MLEASNRVEINTLEGRVRGQIDDGLAIFRGIPFAQAPTGPLRFMAPVPPAPRSGVLDAISPCPPQISGSTSLGSCAPTNYALAGAAPSEYS